MWLLCAPDGFYAQEPINKKEEKFFKQGIDKAKLQKQHASFCKVFERLGADFELLPVSENCPEQTFTRDIGFCVGNKFFVCKMTENIRKPETKVLLSYLKNSRFSRFEIIKLKNRIEGGDVILVGKKIYLGIGGRTQMAAAEELAAYLPDYKIIPIRLGQDVLHLDCVLGFINSKTALAYKKGIKDVEFLKNLKILEINDTEYANMATNFVKIGKTFVCDKKNKRVNSIIQNHGFDVVELSFSEFSKLGGLFRCCTLKI